MKTAKTPRPRLCLSLCALPSVKAETKLSIPFMPTCLRVIACPNARLYSMTTTAPRAFIVSMIFSHSSLGTFSFICLGALSTNFFESTKLRPSMLLTSLMTLGFAPASKLCSFRVKSVFSCAAGAASSSSAASAAAGAAAGAAAKPPTGMSGMFKRVWTENA
ncbi:hypothetical protein IWX92DRAFT_28764 [Phyllosticta citricarpa]